MNIWVENTNPSINNDFAEKKHAERSCASQGSSVRFALQIPHANVSLHAEFCVTRYVDKGLIMTTVTQSVTQ